MSYERILVPIDFSDDSLNALNKAVAEFGKPNTTIVLLHVVDAGSDDANALSEGRKQAVSRGTISPDEAPGPDPTAARLKQLQDLAAPHAGKCKQLDVQVALGQPTEKIIEAVTAHAINLVIMGSHGIGGLGKMLFGSTTYDVARKVRCSVLISKR
jgi:nucleotide-binding universal stress UspA family protein